MTATENPIDNDDRLKGLLSSIRDVKTRKAYHSWRKAFLKIYCKYLDPNGILNGKDANYRLLQQLQQLSNRIELVLKGPLATGQGPTQIASAHGRRLLTNLTDQVQATERKVQELLPKTDADEERFGFDKFELAAVLLEDGFHGYDALLDSRVVLDSIARQLENQDNNDNTIYTNELTILRQYADSVESFVRVMEDLKLVPVMTQCVEVVYKGKDRPEPKPPPPPEEPVEPEYGIEDEEELPEDSSICSDFDLLAVAETPVGNAMPSSSDLEDDDEDDEPTSTSSATAERKKPKTKKKKKKSTTATKKPKDKSSSSASSVPAASGKKKKTKKPKKSSRSKEQYATTSGDDTDDVLDEEDEDRPSRPTAKPKTSRKNHKNRSAASQDDDNEDEDESSSNTNDEEEEEQDDDDQEEGPPPESEFLLFFDPKTNSIGRIDRAQAVAQSSLLTDKSQEGTAQGAYGDVYRNVIDSQDEKQEIIFMLKKLERQKPQEESWLDAIKKEKAAAKAANGGKNAPKKFHKSTSRISRRNSATSASKTSTSSSNPSKKSGVGMGRHIVGSGGTYTSPLKADKKAVDAETIKAEPTFRNPLESANTNDNNKGRRLSNKTGGKSKKKNNYKDIYKQVADKPDDSGWSKPASSRGLLQ